MKTRFLIIIGMAVIGMFIFLFLSDGQQNTCEQMGGTWNIDHCMVTQEIIDSNQLTCDPGPIMENGTCSSHGLTLVIQSRISEPEPEQFKTHSGLALLNQSEQKNAEENNTPDQLRGVFGNCACQERVKSNPDTMERCIQPDLAWENSTHYIDNNICEWREK